MKNITPAQQKMLDLFDNHVNAELAGDLETTMATMTDNPHLINVAVLMGGSGKEGVRTFYRNYLVGKFFPPDVEMINVSRTVDDEQIVDEVVIKFTHTTPVDWMLPEVAPTGKRVEVALVVVVKVEDGKVAHEHIYWDQASVLVQIGLLDPKHLPVGGVGGARMILDPTIPPRKVKPS
ncbi:MAG: carboxymethylenebutenolidase [Deltaproteobacteria bacterium CG_4_10_14_0_2_um_filter_43_8]|nr:MAG: carboxymethylenebutenolidase [Deltaproteobacteria bacterium CG11_big_fil_rev_8_21_14_0_20_42_23]PJA19042.1 MAG: carboxymethylenebutenolidase [Deltaproteobacteria bacterium CG_4_10_14_0_2_um_filter_43_8]PJC65178.1 MAG: carboxymethylenebutenolidase [Deltaproteobacteria bacterium CG_4_9_14_0_2_um_filter_42_21]